MAAELYAVAKAALTAGIAVVPPAEDGTKRPLTEWKLYQERRPTSGKLASWYADGRYSGIGVVCGEVSGGLECLEFDDRATFDAFLDTADRCGLGELIGRIRSGYEEETPGGGVHWLYRCPTIAGNTKLARRPKQPDEMRDEHDRVKVLIETRGRGGYIIIAPSNGRVHPSGLPYRKTHGGVDTITMITEAERDELLSLARSFDQMPRPASAEPTTPRPDTSGTRPGDAFNARAAWGDVLEPHGWRYLFSRGDEGFWRRPGKDQGISATTNYSGSGLLYVFSSSTDFEPERGYSKFSAYSLLEHGGDFEAAARTLAAQGYGDPPRGGPAQVHVNGHEPAAEAVGTSVSGAAPVSGEDVVWETRLPLPPAAPAVPTMPPELVPASLRAWVGDVAERLRLPVEMIAVPAIVGAGAVVGRGMGIRPERYDDFLVVPNLWGAVVARPGWLKSAALDEAVRPVKRLAATARDEYERDRDRLVAKQERIAAEIDHIKRRMRGAVKGDDDDELLALEAELATKQKELRTATVAQRRYLTHDATVEKLGELLRDNPRGLLVLRDELGGWIRLLDKQGREGDREFYLEAWNGTGSYDVDRVGRGEVHIPALTLSILGGIQPGKLRTLIGGALDGEADDDGLLQRVQLLVWPDALGAWRKIDRWPNGEARSKAAELFRRLDALKPGDAGAVEEEGVIPYLRLADNAQTVWDEWRDALEHRLRSDELAATPALASHLSKYRSLLPSLALIFHLLDITDRRVSGKVGESAVRLAAAWCDFLELHARKIYAAELDAGASAAYALATKLKAEAVFDGQPVRELYRAQWSGLKTPEQVLAGLTTLADLGWLRLKTQQTGGRPTQVVFLHPDLKGRATDA